jgi:hypothetical protein
MRHLAALSLLLAGCAAQPTLDEGRREASIPVVAPPAVPRAPRRVIQTSWAFEAGDDECAAVAAGGRSSLQVTVRRNNPVRMTITLLAPLQPSKPASVALRFNGPAGRWQVNARQVAGRQLAAVLGSGDMALSRVLVLLSGGVLEVGEQDQAIPSLGLASSEARGQIWFDCARRNTI